MAKLKLNLERVFRAHAFLAASSEYGVRWWERQPQPRPARITDVQGDNRPPFNRIDVSPDDFIAAAPESGLVLRAQFIVGVAAVLETYLYDVHMRALHLRPDLIGGDGPNPTFSAEELVHAERAPSFRWWLAQEVTERRLRGASHEKMVERVAALIPIDVKRGTNRAHLDSWLRWAAVRNAIAHAGMTISADLVKAWPDRFPQRGAPLALDIKDVNAAGADALRLAKVLDGRFVSEVVKESDAELLVQETHARLGIGDPGQLAAKVYETLAVPMNSKKTQRILATQRETAGDVFGFRFSDALLRV